MFYEIAVRESPSVRKVAKIALDCQWGASRVKDKAPLDLTEPVAAGLSELTGALAEEFPMEPDEGGEEAEAEGAAAEEELEFAATACPPAWVRSVTSETGPVESAAFCYGAEPLIRAKLMVCQPFALIWG